MHLTGSLNREKGSFIQMQIVCVPKELRLRESCELAAIFDFLSKIIHIRKT